MNFKKKNNVECRVFSFQSLSGTIPSPEGCGPYIQVRTHKMHEQQFFSSLIAVKRLLEIKKSIVDRFKIAKKNLQAAHALLESRKAEKEKKTTKMARRCHPPAHNPPTHRSLQSIDKQQRYRFSLQRRHSWCAVDARVDPYEDMAPNKEVARNA